MRTVQLQACPAEDTEVGDLPDVCSAPTSGEHIGGRLTLLLSSKEAATVTVGYLPDDGSSVIPLPGDSKWVFFIGKGPESPGFLDSVLGGVTGSLKGSLLDKVEASLPELAKIAFGRVAGATRIAKSPLVAKTIAAAIGGGVEAIAPLELRSLAPTIEKLIAPQGDDLNLSNGEVQDLLFDLGEAVTPPGVDLASDVLGSVISGATESVAESSLELQGKVPQPLSIGFALPPEASVGAIDGKLILQAGESDPPVIIPVSGKLREFKDLALSPATLNIDSDEPESTVTLSGPEAVEFLRFGGFGSGRTVTLNDDSGHTAEVTVEFPAAADAAGENPQLVKGTVSLKGDPPAGKYTGKLSLADFSSGGPTMDLEVHSHRCFLWFVLIAFFGVFLGGLATRVVAFAIRRRGLLELLRQSKGTYDHVHEHARKKKIRTASWHLGDLFGETADAVAVEDGRPIGQSSSRLQGLDGLRASIEEARSSKDLDEDTDRVLDMVARIQRWLRVEPAARRLDLVAGKTTGHLGESWADTKTLRDTRILLRIAQREPADAKAADDLVSRLLRQAEWHHRFGLVWAGAKEKKLEKEAKELDTKLGDKSTVGSRTPEEQDVLDGELQRLLERVGIRDEEVSNLPKPAEPTEGVAGITPVEWDASPNLFTGWATLDGPSYGQLARGAARGARSFKPEDFRRETRALLLGSDAIWTAAALVLACVVYAVTKYDDTWGSPEDFASAFLAGVTGTIVINWAALPIFQSIRARSGQADATEKDSSTEATGEDKPDEPAAVKEGAEEKPSEDAEGSTDKEEEKSED